MLNKNLDYVVVLSVCLQGSPLVFFALGIVFGKHASAENATCGVWCKWAGSVCLSD